MDLFHKIIDEAATIPQINHVTFTGLGETLLDRHLNDRTVYARKKMPHGTLIDIFTNGNILTLERGLRLFDAGLSVMYVSLNAATADKRKAVMGLDDFDKVVAETHKLIDELKRQGRPERVIVKAVVSKDLMEVGDIDVMMKEWGGDHTTGGNLFLHQEGSWGDGVVWKPRIPLTKACGRALGQIMVLSDGRVSACCFDGFGSMIFGDLNKQTIREVYGDPKFVEFREDHDSGQRQKYSLCKDCTGI